MIRLLPIEIRRLLARRVFRVLIGLAVVATVLLLGRQFALSNRDVAGAQARARQQAATEYARNAQSQAVCRQSPPPNAPAGICDVAGPSQDELYRDLYRDPRFSFANSAGGLVGVVVAGASLLGLVIGASYIGAEWAAGTMASMLTWEPRRLRVLWAKLLAAMVVLTVTGLLLTLVALGGAYLVAATRGTTALSTHHLLTTLTTHTLRGLLLVALLTGAGCAVAGFGRGTPVALGATLGYLVVFETVLRNLRPAWARWYVLPNAVAVVQGHLSLFGSQEAERSNSIFFKPARVFVLHADRGAIYLGTLFALFVLVWALTFTRRDVDEGNTR